MTSTRRSVRGVMVGAFSLAAIGVPVGLALASPPETTSLACAGSLSVPIMSVGAPVDTCNVGPMTPPISGGAPSQQALTNCSGIPGCLSSVLYGPGNVYVPGRSTTVQQSQ